MIVDKFSEESIISRFNGRDISALGEVYHLCYREWVYYARQLYRNTDVDGEGVVHDVLIKIWTHSKQQFEGLDNLKAYLYVSLRNSYCNWLSHNAHKRNFEKKESERTHNLFAEIVESETFSQLTQSLKLLPEESARIIRMLIEGWSVKEIATVMEISPSSVYAKKSEGIAKLRKYFYHSKLFIFL